MADQSAAKTRVPSVLDDPSASAVARVYADALLNAIPAGQVEGTLEEFQSFLDDVLARNEDFSRLLLGSSISNDDKITLIDRVIKGRGSELFTNFLRVLAKHGRLDLLPLVLRQCNLQFELRSGKRRVQITSAQPLSADTINAVQTRLAELFPFQPIVEATTDPALLGGLRIRVEDTVYDGTLRARLKQLRRRVRERSLHEIQSGRDRFSSPEGN
jgi:F-type H+-transporting ATPase subunit delta